MHSAVTPPHRQLYPRPSLCRGKMLFRLLILAQAIAILLAFSPGISADPWYRLGIISLYVHWIALLSLVVLCPLLPRLSTLSLVVEWLVTFCRASIERLKFTSFFYGLLIWSGISLVVFVNTSVLYIIHTQGARVAHEGLFGSHEPCFNVCATPSCGQS